ncbi:putative NAD(P)H nitroreductase [Clostridium cavendishii DSM 21758]|uniref:Putative NAD(P)H nitroreductase n=1 Tax=Clostridium cavendishii DSM 21758 TaxID=1121302 RepID=A0A1M6TF79_9CLOT|nr:nitroreductase family protein [Clostridium cavendishii]SHK55675.1 putative NAD(P)H nitroreductase [Clostridium cavendishii DSM 21758]
MINKNFSEIVDERRSANNFEEGVKISKDELNEIFKEVALAPSCFNLQHANYLVINNDSLKEVFREKACNQYKVHTASAAILVLGDKEAYKNAEKLYEPMKWLKIMDSIQYAQTVDAIYKLYESRGESFMQEEAVRNGALSAMLFMLSAKNKGWDTCPMIGFDREETRKLFKIDDKYEIVLLITIGKEDQNNKRFRGYRKPIEEFVTYIE